MPVKVADFDEQLRQAVRAALASPRMTLNELARLSTVSVMTLSGWLNTPTRSLRLDLAEKLARHFAIDLRTTNEHRSKRNKARDLSFDDQMRAAIDGENQTELARRAGVSLSGITRWLGDDLKKISLRFAFALCSVLCKDLLTLPRDR